MVLWTWKSQSYSHHQSLFLFLIVSGQILLVPLPKKIWHPIISVHFTATRERGPDPKESAQESEFHEQDNRSHCASATTYRFMHIISTKHRAPLIHICTLTLPFIKYVQTLEFNSWNKNLRNRGPLKDTLIFNDYEASRADRFILLYINPFSWRATY